MFGYWVDCRCSGHSSQAAEEVSGGLAVEVILGAVAYTLEILMGVVAGVVSIYLIIIQPIMIGT